MDILNKRERNKSFLLFLVMFLIAVGTLIFALFFNFRMPLKENEVLREQNDKITKQFEFSKKFSTDYEYTVKLIDSMKLNPEKQPLYEAKIDAKMKDLIELEKDFNKELDDKDYESSLYSLVIGNLSSLIQARKEANSSSNSQDDIRRVEDKLAACEREKNEYIRQITLLNKQNE